MQKIKVNLNLLPESKEMLDHMKKYLHYSISGTMDQLLQFDDDAAEIFFKLYLNKNKVLSKNLVDRIINMPIEKAPVDWDVEIEDMSDEQRESALDEIANSMSSHPNLY